LEQPLAHFALKVAEVQPPNASSTSAAEKIIAGFRYSECAKKLETLHYARHDHDGSNERIWEREFRIAFAGQSTSERRATVRRTSEQMIIPGLNLFKTLQEEDAALEVTPGGIVPISAIHMAAKLMRGALGRA
jgi:hypothetical protein